jgi:hypothetical protein
MADLKPKKAETGGGLLALDVVQQKQGRPLWERFYPSWAI